jgi:hypothetical protein
VHNSTICGIYYTLYIFGEELFALQFEDQLLNNKARYLNTHLQKIIMHKKINTRAAQRRLTKLLKGTKAAAILPFKESPAANKYRNDDNTSFGGTELFSFFTASIIKEETVFVR